jgi:hypothetical protein
MVPSPYRYCDLILGSTNPYRMSTTRFTRLNIRASIRTPPCMTGKSLEEIDCTMKNPMPRMAKTVSVRIAPPKRPPKESPITVIRGMRAFFRACRTMIADSLCPFAQAVLI